MSPKPNTKICKNVLTAPQLVQFWWDRPCQVRRVHLDFGHLAKRIRQKHWCLWLNFTYLLLMKQNVYPSEVRKHKIISVLLLMAEILHQLISSSSHYLQGFIHPRWCRIFSINSLTLAIQTPIVSYRWKTPNAALCLTVAVVWWSEYNVVV